MSRREVVDCDYCGKQAEPHIQISAEVARTMDPSGNGYETEVQRVDLCPKCTRIAIQSHVGSMSYEHAAAWVARWKRKL